MFDRTKPIFQRPDSSNEPGGLVVTLDNGEQYLLINFGSPWFNPDNEPKGLREEVFEFIEKNPNAVVPEPEPPSPEPSEPQPDTHEFILGLMGVEDND